MVISILAAVAVFATLVVVHEAGHFVVAKRLGVRVLRFSIGYPPRIAGIRRGETDYAIGATPLGGYVRMLGDEIGDDPSPATVELYLKELQLDVIGAVKKGLPAAAAGLRPGDRVMQIGRERMDAWEDLSARVKGGNGKPLLIVVQRPDGNGVTTITLTITPQRVEEGTIYGKAPTWVIGVTPRGDEYKRKISPQRALLEGFTQTARMTATLAVGIAKIVNGTTPARQALGG